MSTTAADDIMKNINQTLLSSNKCTLGLATGSTPRATYQNLLTLLSDKSVNLSNFYTVNLDEYYPIEQSNPHSFHTEMTKRFWEPLHAANPTFDVSHGYILNGEAPDAEIESKRYEDQIKQLGGIDLQILGLGVNGHIAFNEPGSPRDSRTRKIEIAEETRQINMKSFSGDEEKMPQFGLTMGIATILEAKKIFLLVSGETKRPIYEQLFQIQEPTPSIPASFLLQHSDVTVFTDIG